MPMPLKPSALLNIFASQFKLSLFLRKIKRAGFVGAVDLNRLDLLPDAPGWANTPMIAFGSDDIVWGKQVMNAM